MNCPLLALIVFSHCSYPTARSLYRICIPILITDIVCVCVFPYLLFSLFLSFVVWCLWESSEDDQWSGGRLTYPLTATATRIAAWRVVSKLFAKRIVFLLLPLIYALIRFLFSFNLPESLRYEMVSELRFHSINSYRFPYRYLKERVSFRNVSFRFIKDARFHTAVPP
ncbi:unnamed protein product [Trypanosoma congolense IL3000]|uniref:WGS project CAEQ00000000 data, annotated contig 2231 n=1 Tax=Trypanosoma congolense (strain IL3000) TaxID=1068625 RepID=F9WCG8_TRYCI|nr:unnamed protein product [Trypanosoma congolense IL3000]